jgi:hypothetical protein
LKEGWPVLKRLYHRLVSSATRELREQNSELAQRLCKLESVLADLVERAVHIEDKESCLSDELSCLMSKENEISERLSCVENSGAELAVRTAHIEDREIELLERTSRIEKAEAELAVRTAHIEDREIELLERASRIEKAEAELAVRAAHIEDREIELTERCVHIEEREIGLLRDILSARENIEVAKICLSQQIESVGYVLKDSARIHFIRCIDVYNAGDINCSPLDYFSEFKKKFLCYLHTIKNINYSLIHDGDYVVIGGGGMLDCSVQYQAEINRLLSMPVKVVSWGLGHNTHTEDCIFHCDLSRKIAYEKFFILGTRDWQYSEKEMFVPCVSCMMPQLDKKSLCKRRIGVVEHHAIHIDEFDFDKISNSESVEVITDFIASSEIIITNSYHVAYWSILMERKVVVYKPFSNKFDFFKYKPVVYSGNLELDISSAQVYEGAKEEFRRLNIDFSKKVMKCITGK